MVMSVSIADQLVAQQSAAAAALQQHRDAVQRIAFKAARDCGADADELHAELTLDLLHSFHLFDERRGAYTAWAKTRSRLATLRYKRGLRKLGGAHALPICSEAGRDRGGASRTATDPSLAPGAMGNPERMEMQAQLFQLLARADGDQRDRLLDALEGWIPVDAELLDELLRVRRASTSLQIQRLLDDAYEPMSVDALACATGLDDEEVMVAMRHLVQRGTALNVGDAAEPLWVAA